MKMASEKALDLLRQRLCDSSFVYSAFKSTPDGNYSKLKFLISNSIAEACNNSVLLLGPRGCGKGEVVDMVLEELKSDFVEIISVVRLNGLLHADDNFAVKEIARQLCMEHKLIFSKMASFDDNSHFMIDMLRECGLAHKMIIFVLDEFDLFTQGKQRFLYSLLDAMQTLTSQSAVIGISCRMDADQLLEKRVKSRFSHRKLLFTPPSTEDMQRLLEHLLYLPKKSSLPSKYVKEFNSNVHNILSDKKFKEILDALSAVDSNTSNIRRFLYQSISHIHFESGLLTLDGFKTALSCFRRQPMLDKMQDASILELYILVCMYRLGSREQNSFNFNSIMKEYKSIQDAYKTSDNYSWSVCLKAFEHLIDFELISLSDNRMRSLSIEYRPVRLLLSSQELYQGLKSNAFCPVSPIYCCSSLVLFLQLFSLGSYL
ncbi:origin of replication complex subunit 4 [Phalaenopsis equestris]|uniref:origin of replication complex subunit 4 n=1 Tax=Phalaenopsis equestris TaxID=78828 RepID=UPI0009E3145A|nr:origin of replication complex subunit 4 [Phalaenopsis equestris]